MNRTSSFQIHISQVLDWKQGNLHPLLPLKYLNRHRPSLLPDQIAHSQRSAQSRPHIACPALRQRQRPNVGWCLDDVPCWEAYSLGQTDEQTSRTAFAPVRTTWRCSDWALVQDWALMKKRKTILRFGHGYSGLKMALLPEEMLEVLTHKHDSPTIVVCDKRPRHNKLTSHTKEQTTTERDQTKWVVRMMLRLMFEFIDLRLSWLSSVRW